MRVLLWRRLGCRNSLAFYDFFVLEFWRFVYVRKAVGEFAETFIEFPPMQKGASFNMEAVKQQIEAAQKKFHSQYDDRWRRIITPQHQTNAPD